MKFLQRLCFLTVFLVIIFFSTLFAAYEFVYRERIYPGVFVDKTDFSHRTKQELADYLDRQNSFVRETVFELVYKDKKWLASSKDLGWEIDSKGTADSVFSLGRSRHFLANSAFKVKIWFNPVDIDPFFRFDRKKLDDLLRPVSAETDELPVDALFRFKQNKVTAFRVSKLGKKLNREVTIALVDKGLAQKPRKLIIRLPVETVEPKIRTEQANNMGIKESLGRGLSYFYDSIPSRVYNIELAANRLNGVIVAPNEIFSFNQSLGEISQLTGFQQAYIIKDGKTILGDGGGVCQVSTTLFRAVLSAGLPLVERRAHSYRVGFYEQGGFLPGLDATIYPPSPDFRFKNDTPAHILIQEFFDKATQSLAFELYGTSDGRQTVLGKPVVYNVSAPPPPKYQDDPSLSRGVERQVDWAHPGADVYFLRTVVRKKEILIDEKIQSRYIPWAAVFLRGTKEK